MNQSSEKPIKNCVVLFDIDGTLIAGPENSTAPGVLAMDKAAELITGKNGLHKLVEFAGRTDKQIATDLLVASGQIKPTQDNISQLLQHYCELLKIHVSRFPYRPIGKVRNAIEALRQAGCTIGLGTGNVKLGAEIKLKSAGLLNLFDLNLGGYGDDGDSRADVLHAGVNRCDPTGQKFVIVIGDTPHDVYAALAIDALCIGVATGKYNCSELLDAGATVVVFCLDESIMCLPMWEALVEMS